MNLQDADIKRLYFLDSEHPYNFYSQLYNCSNEITIALGYFSGSAFGIGIDGLINFLESDGKLRFLCNDKLYAPDVDAIASGYEAREANPLSIFDVSDLLSKADKYETFGFRCLSYLIEVNRLDIRIVKSDGLVHFKIGYATDSEGNSLSFEGSVNYTLSGLMLNHEQLHTTLGWKNDEDAMFVCEVKNKIEKLWDKNIDGYEIIDGNEIKELIKRRYPVRDIEDLKREYFILKENVIKNINTFKQSQVYKNDTFFQFPEEKKPRDYQIEAIINWENNNYKTLYSMATGTGKTLTALFSVNSLYFTNKKINTVFIIVPLKDLIDQWIEDIKEVFSGNVIKVRSGERWREALYSHKFTTITSSKPLIVISTYNSYSRHCEKLLEFLDTDNTIIIADEVHRFGSEKLKEKLPEKIFYRIGLSATPKREYDDEGTQAIFDYFCPSEEPFIISIEEAIDLGILCKYYYYPIFVKLTEDELVDYSRLTERIRKLQVNENKNKSKKDDLNKLLKQRHRIIEQSRNKFDAFDSLINDLIKNGTAIEKAVIYVPEGTQNDEQIINQYTKLLFSKYRVLVSKYVQGVDKKILDDFREGRINVLAAKKRLDEGVNIPAIEIAFFISSSTVEREFVQRRGRILRKNKGKKYAYIYDFLVIPPINHDLQIADYEIKSIINGELKRAELFASNALNKYESIRKIEDQYL